MYKRISGSRGFCIVLKFLRINPHKNNNGNGCDFGRGQDTNNEMNQIHPWGFLAS